MAAIGWERARVAIRGYDVVAHAPSEPRARLHRVAELYGTLAVDTQLYEPLRAVLFQARALRMAFETTDTAGIARALSLNLVTIVAGPFRAWIAAAPKAWFNGHVHPLRGRDRSGRHGRRVPGPRSRHGQPARDEADGGAQ